MRIVVAPDSFKESLDAAAVAAALARGLRRALPTAEVDEVPVADGGEGTVTALVAATRGRLCTSRVRGPLGAPVDAAWGLLGDGHTAVIEMAAASGLVLLAPGDRDPLRTSSFGTGQLVRAAVAAGARHIILGLGGSATNDGGAGFLQALGMRFRGVGGVPLPEGIAGGDLAHVVDLEGGGLAVVLRGVTLEAACDVDNPLCGARGASAVFGPQKGADADAVVRLDEALGHLYGMAQVRGWPDCRLQLGAGAAGGMGAALATFLAAPLRPGVDLVLDALGFEQRLRGADLVVTGEGRLDAQTLHGKAPAGVARRAAALGIPVIAACGSLELDDDALLNGPFAAAEAAVCRPLSTAAALATAAHALEQAGLRIGRWLALGTRLSSPPPA